MGNRIRNRRKHRDRQAKQHHSHHPTGRQQSAAHSLRGFNDPLSARVDDRLVTEALEGLRLLYEEAAIVEGSLTNRVARWCQAQGVTPLPHLRQAISCLAAAMMFARRAKIPPGQHMGDVTKAALLQIVERSVEHADEEAMAAALIQLNDAIEETTGPSPEPLSAVG